MREQREERRGEEETRETREEIKNNIRGEKGSKEKNRGEYIKERGDNFGNKRRKEETKDGR